MARFSRVLYFAAPYLLSRYRLDLGTDLGHTHRAMQNYVNGIIIIG